MAAQLWYPSRVLSSHSLHLGAPSHCPRQDGMIGPILVKELALQSTLVTESGLIWFS